MAGNKHSLDGNEVESDPPLSPYIPMFEAFRSELDEHHDRRERVVKASRDITALSKKMIFSLQRVHTLQSATPPHVAKGNDPRQQQIHELFTAISSDLQGPNAWRYQRQIASGIQEYIEAISFHHYLTTQMLLTHSEAQKMIPGNIPLTEDDYLLGLFDLIGELMRFAITTIATSGSLPRGAEAGRDVLEDLRVLRMQFESLDTSTGAGNSSPLHREVVKKMEIMRTCVEKVEAAVYGIIIRGRERPKGWMPDLEGAGKREVETY